MLIYVCAPKVINMKQSLNDWLNKLYCFPVSVNRPTVNLFRGCDLSNEVHLKFLSKKAKVKL